MQEHEFEYPKKSSEQQVNILFHPIRLLMQGRRPSKLLFWSNIVQKSVDSDPDGKNAADNPEKTIWENRYKLWSIAFRFFLKPISKILLDGINRHKSNTLNFYKKRPADFNHARGSLICTFGENWECPLRKKLHFVVSLSMFRCKNIGQDIVFEWPLSIKF